MWEQPLSFTILEFFTWNPGWDPHLTKMMEDRQKTDADKKDEPACDTNKCSSGCGGCS